MATEIIPRISIGDVKDAQRWPRDNDHFIVCVMDQMPMGEPSGAMWLKVGTPPQAANLKAAAAVLNAAYDRGQTILVHDTSGDDAAPLVVAAFFKIHGEMPVDAACKLVRFKRETAKLDPAKLARI